MGQYHRCVNLDKREFIDPHKLGNGLKLREQVASHPGTGAALIILLASASNGQGGGDLDQSPIVGRWRGDRIAFVGDYDDEAFYWTGSPENGELVRASDIYSCTVTDDDPKDWKDVSLQVCKVIEKELCGKFVGDGWREFKPSKKKSVNNGHAVTSG